MTRWIRSILAACLVGAGLSTAVVATPAHAANPSCNSSSAAYNVHGGVNGAHGLLPAYNGNTNTYCDLGSWLSGTNNRGTVALQRALNTCYRQGLAVDGSYGPLTVAAVKRVQRAVGVRVDGVYGPITKSAMSWPMYASTGSFVGCYQGNLLNDL